MFWRIHKALAKDRLEEILDILKDDEVQVAAGAPYSAYWTHSPDHVKGPAFALTTLQDARILKSHPFINTFYHETEYNVSHWMSHLPEDIPVLNRGGIFVPFSQIPYLPDVLLQQWKSSVFVKPNSSFKLFTGFTINGWRWKDIYKELSVIANKVNPDTLVYISDYKELYEVELRFWIVDGKVVAHSPYSWNEDKPFHDQHDYKASLKVAEMVAKCDLYKELSCGANFVVDIGYDLGLQRYGVIEINCLGTSGLYQADLTKLLPAIRQAEQESWEMMNT